MQLEIGGIYEGKVKSIAKYGAFINFENGQSGMVHISEVSGSFVSEIREFLEEGQTVRVKVLSIGDDGKISLSIKKADENYAPPDKKERRQPKAQQRRPFVSKPPAPMPGKPGDFEWKGSSNNSGDFEDMMSKFKKNSEEKISELKKANDVGKGYSRRGRK